jgi:glycosyltransferase involved in cell wall biosynthesis
MKLAIVSFGHADSIMHYAKTLSVFYDVDLIFVFALNKRIESVLNFENENLHTGFLKNEQVERILGKPLMKFKGDSYKIKFFINHNLKIRSLKNIRLAKELTKKLDEYDIVHFNGMDATLLLYNYFLKHKRKVFTVHDIKLHTGERDQKFINVPERFVKWLIKSEYQLLIQNKSDYKEIIEKYPDKKNKINFIPFKCLSIFRSFLKEGDPGEYKSDVLFFGRISPYKGLKYLVDAMEIVRKTLPDARLLIAGSGNIDNDLPEEKRNESIAIHNRYITNEEMATIISDTKISICPYIDATQSGVVMTSFAFGKPVIASSVGGFPDVVENNITGTLVPPRDIKALAGAIIDLLTDKNKLKMMEKNIIEKCENGSLSWKSIAEDAKNVYNKTLAKNKYG